MSTDVTVGLIRALVDNTARVPEDWESLAMVVDYFDGAFSGAAGFAYSPDGTVTPVAADPWAVRSAVTSYTDSYYQPGEALPVRFLVQFDRTNGRYNVTFEDTDETRWKVTPRNWREIREELRPRFA